MARRALAALLAVLLLLTPPAGATWSLILVDSSTGEVGIASATCLELFDLRKFLPVVVVGKGAAAAQSQIDMGATNRKKIWNMLHAGVPPLQIIQTINDADILKCSRQYGIVDASPAAAGFTGACAGAYKKHVTGSFGSITYAVQGNVLTGQPVIDAIVSAIGGTQGRLSDRFMAGMQAARAMGGDGRCSCAPNNPTGCGAPPPQFEKSAHVGFVIVARVGDADGLCNGSLGCANGDYWLNLNVVGGETDPDPVDTLQVRYDSFLQRMQGLPDGVTSFAVWDQPFVRGDGLSTAELTVVLLDLDGNPVGRGGYLLDVQHAPNSAGLSQRQAVVDHGDGTYSLHVQAGQGSGIDRYAIRVVGEHGRQATLFPYPELTHLRTGPRR